MKLVNLDRIKEMREGNVKGETVSIKRGLLKSKAKRGEFSASMYEFDSGANSIEKQTSGLQRYQTISTTSPKLERESKIKDVMSKDLSDVHKDEILRYRDALAKRLTEDKKAKKKKSSTIGKRLLKYKNPLPAKVKGDITRQKNIEGDSDISPII